MLGAAAGGGFPQWNCGCPQCNLARAGDARAKPRTQAGAAVTADGEAWLLVGASPDLRQQILANPPLAPTAPRHSPIAGAVLVSADVDGLTGLLTLREQQPLRLWAPAAILKILEENSLFPSLDPTLVQRIEIFPNVPIDVGLGLTLTLLPMPGKCRSIRRTARPRRPSPPPPTPLDAAIMTAGPDAIRSLVPHQFCALICAAR